MRRAFMTVFWLVLAILSGTLLQLILHYVALHVALAWNMLPSAFLLDLTDYPFIPGILAVTALLLAACGALPGTASGEFEVEYGDLTVWGIVRKVVVTLIWVLVAQIGLFLLTMGVFGSTIILPHSVFAGLSGKMPAEGFAITIVYGQWLAAGIALILGLMGKLPLTRARAIVRRKRVKKKSPR